MSADFNGPIPADGKIEVLQTIRDNQDAIATAFDGDPTAANKPTNAFRVDQSDGQAYKWNGSSWVSLGYISLARDPVNDIVAGAPAALDTLNELADALADDANFASTVTTSLDQKMAKSQNLNDVSNKATARNNLDVYSTSQVYQKSETYTKAEVDSLQGETVQYAAYIDETLATGTTQTSSLLGTRIDVTSGSYSSSSFNFRMSGQIFTEASPNRGANIDIIVKKESAGDPYAILRWSGNNSNQDNNHFSGIHAKGSLASSASVVTATTAVETDINEVELERVDSSNELCFRLNFDADSNLARTLILWIEGPRTYAGTLISSTNGTTF